MLRMASARSRCVAGAWWEGGPRGGCVVCMPTVRCRVSGGRRRMPRCMSHAALESHSGASIRRMACRVGLCMEVSGNARVRFFVFCVRAAALGRLNQPDDRHARRRGPVFGDQDKRMRLVLIHRPHLPAAQPQLPPPPSDSPFGLSCAAHRRVRSGIAGARCTPRARSAWLRCAARQLGCATLAERLRSAVWWSPVRTHGRALRSGSAHATVGMVRRVRLGRRRRIFARARACVWVCA